MLLSASASTMARDSDGWLPLHVACLNNAAAAAQACVLHTPGCAAHRTDDGDAPIDLARKYDLAEMVTLLTAPGIPQPLDPPDDEDEPDGMVVSDED